MRALRWSLRLRRVEFLVAEIPILVIPLLLASGGGAAPLRPRLVAEGTLLFFLLFNFGDLTNCLADRDLDAIYKKHLSEAVYGLGLRNVKIQIAVTLTACLGLAVHLAVALDRWLVLPLVVAGLVLAAAYSQPPVRLKGRGLWQLVCLWLVIFVGPMILAATFATPLPSLLLVGLAATYGAAQMGTILINTAEDYPEDRHEGIRTTIVALGLHRGVAFGAWLTTAGMAGVIGAFAVAFAMRGVGGVWWGAVALVGAGGLFAVSGVWKVHRAIAGASVDAAAMMVKAAAPKVPIWLTAVAWSSLAAAVVTRFAATR